MNDLTNPQVYLVALWRAPPLCWEPVDQLLHLELKPPWLRILCMIYFCAEPLLLLRAKVVDNTCVLLLKSDCECRLLLVIEYLYVVVLVRLLK